MARKDWGDLSASYRHRLEGAGISRSQYESGASLKGARGHARTPEHPHRPAKWADAHHPQQYRVGTQDVEKPGSYATKADVQAAMRRAGEGELDVLVKGVYRYRGGRRFEEDFVTLTGRSEELAELLDRHEFLEDALEQWAPGVEWQAATYVSVARVE